MINSWRLLVAVVLSLVGGAGVATAQTVLIKNAPAGEAIEVVLNATKVASASAGPAGDATLPLDLSSIGKTEIDSNIFVDACDALHRIIVVERTKLPDPQPTGCVRRDIQGLYWIRNINTLVFDLGGPSPAMLLIKGKYHPDRPHTWTLAPSGLVLSGGGAWSSVSNEVALSCGSLTACSGKSAGLTYTAGVTYWFLPFLGVEGSYIKPRKVTAQGGDTFTFNSSLDPQIGTIAGKAGIPIGPVRLFGQFGLGYHKATSTTTETINGASQTLTFKTKGWGLAFGGGMEVWAAHSFALYLDVNSIKMKGSDEAGGEGRIDDRVTVLAFGARIRIGR